MQPLLRRTTTPTSTAASTCSASAPPRPTRRPASRCSASSTPPTRARSSSSAAPPRASTWSPRPTAASTSGAGDEIVISAHGAPLQHRPLADALRGDGRASCASCRSTTTASCCSTSTRSCSTPRTQLVVGGPRVQRAGHDQPGAARSSSWPTPRRAGAGRRRPGGAAPAGRRAASWTATSTPSPATSCTARPASACCTARPALLEAMPPYQGGGDMIRSVTFEKTTYNDLPYKFEAGTPNIAGAIGLGAALDYLNGIGLEAVAAHEHELLAYATEALAAIPGLRLIGTAPRQGERPVVRAGRRPSARHRHDARPGRHRRPHRPPLLPAGDGPLRRAGHGARLVRLLQHARGDRRPGAGASHKVKEMFALMSDLRELYQEVILDHNKRPRNFRVLDRRRPPRRGLQPALRRPGDRLPEAGRRRGQRRQLPGHRLRHLDGVGVA